MCYLFSFQLTEQWRKIKNSSTRSSRDPATLLPRISVCQRTFNSLHTANWKAEDVRCELLRVYFLFMRPWSNSADFQSAMFRYKSRMPSPKRNFLRTRFCANPTFRHKNLRDIGAGSWFWCIWSREWLWYRNSTTTRREWSLHWASRAFAASSVSIPSGVA